ncbi:MAG: hypothetical protein ABI402_17495 [Ferruginibacter sp.]
MKNKQLYLSIAIAIICCIGFSAFKNNSENKKFETMFIVTEHRDLDNVSVSIDGKDYKKFNFDKEIKGTGDLNPIINLIHQYEEEGWQLVSVNFGPAVAGGHGFWLQRVKN